MGAKCVPESNTYDQVMQINAVKCSAEVSLSETPTPNGIADSPPASESKGKLPAAESPATEAETYTPKSNGGPVVASATDETRNLPDKALPCVKSNGGPAVASATAETRSLPGKTSNHSRKPSIGTTSLKANGSAKNGDSLSSFRSTSTMSSGSIASNISQLCEKYFMQPLIRSRSFPSDMPHNENSSSSRSMPYLHLRRRKGKCLRKFCMRFLPPAAACSGVLAYGFNRVADQNLGKSQPGDGTKPVFPFGFSKGNSGLETQGIQPSREAVSTTKLQKLRDTVREEALDKPPFNFFICHTEEDYVPYVDKLVKKCEKEGVSIFSRSYSLLWGDSQRIDTQLAISSALFGIVLLSPALLESYRSSWCEKDLDVLFDRNTSANGSHSVILPIYCGGITHELVQAKYPFLSTHIRLLYEDHKVDGIVKQMKLVLEKRKATASQHKPTSPVYRPHAHDVAPKDAVSELDIVCEVKTEEIGQVCTRPKNLAVDSENGQPINSSFTSASSPSKINGVLKSSGCKSSAKKTLRINPDPKVLKTEPLYRSVGVVNHCGHCGPMSSKYRAATIYTESQMDAEAELMEKIHQARIVGDSASESGGEDGDEDDGDEKLLGDPAKLNDLLSYPLSSLRFEVLRLLSIMMDPLAVVGTDFTHFAAQIGFCSTYIRYLKALDIKKNSPFEEVLQIWQDSAPDTTIGDLMYLLNEIRRKDVVYKLNEYYPILSDQ